jgi:hypothetical protein
MMIVQHAIGRLSVFGMFEGMPSLNQVDRLLDHGAPPTPILARATLKPEGGDDINLFCDQVREGCDKPNGQGGNGEARPQPPTTSSR